MRLILAVALTLITLPSAGREQNQPQSKQSAGAITNSKASVRLSLPDAILIGMRKSPQVRSAFLQRVSDRFALYIAEQAYKPQVSLEAAAINSRSLGVNGSSVLAAPTLTWALPTGAMLSAGLTNSQNRVQSQLGSSYSQLSFQVIQPLLRGAGREVATADLRVSQIQDKINKLTLAATVNEAITQIILTYRSVVVSQKQWQIATESFQRANVLLGINQELISAGRMAQADLLQSQLSVTQQELSVASAKEAYDNAKEDLIILIGLDLNASFDVEERVDVKPVHIDEQKALLMAFEHQPAYLAEILALEIGRIDLMLAKDQRRWNLSFVAGGGQQATGTGVFQSFHDLSHSKSDYTVGLQLSVPFTNYAAQKNELNANVSLQQAEIRKGLITDQLTQTIRQTVRRIGIQEGALRVTSRAKELARKQLAIETEKLQAGRSSNFQVVSFQNAFQAAESSETVASFDYLNTLTELDRNLGTTLDTWKIELSDQ